MEEKFVRLADLQKFPLRKDHYDKEHGNKHFIYGIETVFEYVDELPKYEIEVRAEGVVAEDTLCKALECCTMETDGKTCPCDSCPRDNGDYYDTDCIKANCVEALDVIRHQRATIEFLQKTIRENEQRHLEAMLERTDEAEAEAIKVFAKRLKANMSNIARMEFGGNIYFCVGYDLIDNLVKEMTEARNDRTN